MESRQDSESSRAGLAWRSTKEELWMGSLAWVGEGSFGETNSGFMLYMGISLRRVEHISEVIR